MSAVGSVIIVGIGFYMPGLPKERIQVGNMLPAIFLPLLYLASGGGTGGLRGL